VLEKALLLLILHWHWPRHDARIGLMDADIYGPSVPIMFGVRGERPMMHDVNGKGMIIPLNATALS
jgi:ATP-binding protein involved in chromosome partitioning